MKKLLGAVLVVGCWSSTSAPVTEPVAEAPAPRAPEVAPVGGAEYGGTEYGILGVLNTPPSGAFAALTGTGDLSSGFDDTNIYGGLLGEDGDATGAGGLGASGGGQGGGGTGWGTIGTGRYGTLGPGLGSGSGGLRGRVKPSLVRVGQAGVQAGSLDPAIIRRYVKRNLQRLQFCYEKQLLAVPTLAGTVKATFTIGSTGRVTTATVTGMPQIDTCVADALKGIEFPKPQGGGEVIVTYPFTFAPG